MMNDDICNVSGLIASHGARHENKNPCEMSHHSYHVHQYYVWWFFFLFQLAIVHHGFYNVSS